MAKKVLLIVFGAVLALIGVCLTFGGAVLLVFTGGDGYFGGGPESLRTSTAALVSEPAALDGSGDRFDATVRIRVSSSGTGPVFVGVGPTADIDRYLEGSSYDEVRDIRFSPFRYTLSRHDGESKPEPPGDQQFWTARATGSGEQTLEFRLDRGDHRVVVMNADASTPVEVRASFGIRVPVLRGLGIGLIVGGVIGALVGIGLLVLGVRTKVPPRQPPWGGYGQPGYGYPPAGQAPQGYPYPPPGYAGPPPQQSAPPPESPPPSRTSE